MRPHSGPLKQLALKFGPMVLLTLMVLGLTSTWFLNTRRSVPKLELILLNYEPLPTGLRAKVKLVNYGPGSVVIYMTSSPKWECVGETDFGMRTNRGDPFTGASYIMRARSDLEFRVSIPDGSKRWQAGFYYGVENIRVKLADSPVGQLLPQFVYTPLPKVDIYAEQFHSKWFVVPERTAD